MVSIGDQVRVTVMPFTLLGREISRDFGRYIWEVVDVVDDAIWLRCGPTRALVKESQVRLYTPKHDVDAVAFGIAEAMVKAGHLEWVPCAEDPLAQRTLRVKPTASI